MTRAAEVKTQALQEHNQALSVMPSRLLPKRGAPITARVLLQAQAARTLVVSCVSERQESLIAAGRWQRRTCALDCTLSLRLMGR